MARTKTAPSGQVNKYDAELAEFAKSFAAQETPTAQFFSLKSGQLSFGGSPVPNNEMAVVVVDGVLENVYYEGDYDPDSPSSPVCFAFGREEKSMEPHKDCHKAQNPQCSNCPHNQFGSADKGKGKACRNVRRVAMLVAGTLTNGRFEPFDELDHFKTAGAGYMKVPPMSVGGYKTFVNGLATGFKRPPFAFFTKVKVVPDAKSQFRVTFEPLCEVPSELIPILKARFEEVSKVIDFPYSYSEDEEPAKKPAKKPAKYARR